MKLHLVDGTYELFRAFYGAPAASDREGREVGATLGVIRSLLSLVRYDEATHVACAFDHVIESFRNRLFQGYKTGENIDPKLRAQFELVETAAWAAGFVVWPMVEFEADDVLAAAASRWRQHPAVEQIIICSPDKDLAQCVVGKRVVCFSRRTREMLDEDGVKNKFGVEPASIPDWLALVGDAADGIPGIAGWGKKSAATALAKYKHLENIPNYSMEWTVSLRGAKKLAANLRASRTQLDLYRELATLRTDVPLSESLQQLEWKGVRRGPFTELARKLQDESLPQRVARWREED